MAEQWLIDGYNLLHAIRSVAPKRSLPSREQLFAWISEFASFKKTNTLIVLDGVGDDQELRSYRTPNFEAVYSREIPADTYIERYLFQNREKMRMVIVTDDRAIANSGRGGGSQVLSTTAFVELLKECKKEGSEFLQKEKSREHGFNRPFKDKLKDL